MFMNLFGVATLVAVLIGAGLCGLLGYALLVANGVRRHRLLYLPLALGAGLCLAHPVLAATATAPAATGVIDFSGLVNGYVLPALSAVLLAVASWAVNKLAAWFHISVQDSQRQLVSNAIDNAIAYAQKLLAGKEQVTTGEVVSTAVNYILPKIPGTLSALGMTPEHLGQIITAKLPPAAA